jgi:hypothetical protein
MAINNLYQKSCHRSSAMTARTSDAISVSKSVSHQQPEFVRLPKSGQRCPWTGMSRASLNELVLGSRARVHSVVLRRAGASRGIRLIHLESLLHYLHVEMDAQTNLPHEDYKSRTTGKTDSKA